MPEIRIFIVDDHILFRESLTRVLETTSDFTVVGQCSTVSEALLALECVCADVILLDYDLGEDSALRLLRELQLRKTGARVLMVTAGLSDEATLQAMESGALGVFHKRSTSDQLVAAIQQVATGQLWMDSGAVQGLLAGGRSRTRILERTRPLTRRQSEVLRGIQDGQANKEIAWKLQSSESSVKAVIQELFHKAGVRTRSQLVRIAIEKHSSDWLKPEAGV